jgi:osmotically-inducible protein OsmY
MKLASNALVFGTAVLAFSAYCLAAPLTESEKATTDAVGTVVAGMSAPGGLSDREVTKRVQAALRSDPYVYAEHVSVTSAGGVVTLQGLVADEWDLRSAIRISSRVAGVRRVVDELEITDFGRAGT